jgi:hypothetical protein
MLNRRGAVRIDVGCGQPVPISLLAESAGLSYAALAGRLKNGWDLDRALTTPQRVKTG